MREEAAPLERHGNASPEIAETGRAWVRNYLGDDWVEVEPGIYRHKPAMRDNVSEPPGSTAVDASAEDALTRLVSETPA